MVRSVRRVRCPRRRSPGCQAPDEGGRFLGERAAAKLDGVLPEFGPAGGGDRRGELVADNPQHIGPEGASGMSDLNPQVKG